jgi:hypothetical protein
VQKLAAAGLALPVPTIEAATLRSVAPAGAIEITLYARPRIALDVVRPEPVTVTVVVPDVQPAPLITVDFVKPKPVVVTLAVPQQQNVAVVKPSPLPLKRVA